MTGYEASLPGLTTRALGRQAICLPRVGSTNDYVKEHAAALQTGAVVYTLCQTAGRGRRGKDWDGAAGRMLALSVLLRPAPARALPVLPLCVGLAAAEELEALTGGVFGIKWPNDVLCGGRKIAGILCEGFSIGGEGAAVLGIGFNLDGAIVDFDRAGLPYAGSILSETGRKAPPEAVSAALLNQLEVVMDACEAGGFPAVQARFEKKCLTIGREVRVFGANGALTGVAAGLAADGALLVDCGGEEICIRSGEASVRGLYGYV